MQYKAKQLFIPIPEILRTDVLLKMRISNAKRIYAISVIGFLFAFLILNLDYIRYSNGKLLSDSLYFYLFLNHLGLFLFIFPIITIQMNREAFDAGRFRYGRFFIYTWTLFLGAMLLTMAILTFSARTSLSIYFIYIIIANFGLLMVHLDRVLLNSVSFSVITAAIIYILYGDLELIVSNLMEALGVTMVSFVVSTQIFNSYLGKLIADNILKGKNAEIAKEKKRGDELLNNILPKEIANELKATGKAKTKIHNDVTILFTDFIGFTELVASIPAKKLVEELNEIFSRFDDIMEEFYIEKIETIGDAYMAACGLPKENSDHALRCVNAAQQMINFLKHRNNRSKIQWNMRVGIHSGPVVAGVVGKKKFAYDLFGDTINTASRIESNGQSGKINISQTTYELLKENPTFTFESRGRIAAKGKGKLEMWFVNPDLKNRSQQILDL